MKYYEQEYEPLEDLLSFRDSFKLDFLKQKQQLEAKKEILFTKDIQSWGYTEGSVDDLISKDLFDKDQAFNYMLTEETIKIEEMG